MKKEVRILTLNIFLNTLIAIIKIVGGIISGLGSMIADGMHTLGDLIVNVISLVGAKISRKKPEKHHPYGFGRVEYLTNLFVGIILLLIGLFILYNSFDKVHIVPPNYILYFLLASILIKVVAVLITYKQGKKTNSKILLTVADESTADIYSTLGVMILVVVLLIFPTYNLVILDIIVTIIISLMIIHEAYKIIKHNSLALIGELEEDKEQLNKVKEFLLEYHDEISDEDIYLIKYGSYYKMHLNIKLKKEMTMKHLIKLEKEIKKDIIRHRSLKIKHITIYVTDHLDKEV